MTLVRVGGAEASKNAQLSPGVSKALWRDDAFIFGEAGTAIASWQMWTFSGVQLWFTLPNLASVLDLDQVFVRALVASGPLADPNTEWVIVPIDTIDVSSGLPTSYCYAFTLGRVVRSEYEPSVPTYTAPVELLNAPQVCLAHTVTFLLAGTYDGAAVPIPIDASIVAKS